MDQRYPGYNPNQSPAPIQKVRNPTPEELAAQKNQVAKAQYVQNPTPTVNSIANNIKVSNNVNQQITLEHLKEKYGVPMKFIDDFEPDPVPFKLPSTNKVVQTGLTANGEIFVRRFSTEEESKLANMKSNRDFFSILNQILDSCIKSDISVSALSEIDKIPLFLFLMGLTYGGEVNIGPINGCPTCTPNTIVNINILDDLNIAYIPEDYEYPLKVKLNSVPEGEIVFHFPRITNEATMFNDNGKDFSKQITELAIDIKAQKKNGQQVAKSEWEAVLKYIDNNDKGAVSKKLNEFSKFGLVMTIKKFNCSKGVDCDQTTKDSIPLDLEKVMLSLRDKITKTNNEILGESLF